jgi:Domain of unknown function (DUF1844)
MADREKSEIKITDRRLFNEEGELRSDIAEERTPAERETAPPPSPPSTVDEGVRKASAQTRDEQAGENPRAAAVHPADSVAPPDQAPPDAPTAAEEQASRDAFRDAAVKLDDALNKALGDQHRPEALEATFESFIASLYMSAMFQLGLLREKDEQAPPQVDIVGARHTIDTLSMLEEKTRGNLSDNEKSILQDCLFRLRMAFVEITNLLTRPPAPGSVPPGAGRNPGKK